MPSAKIEALIRAIDKGIKKDYDNTIKKAGEMGYTSVEAAGYGNGKFYGKTPEEFKKSVEDAGMKVLSSHMNRPLTKEELQTKDFSKALAWWDEAIAAHKAAARDEYQGTDDSSLVERMGGRVCCVECSRDNIKITVPEDLAIAEATLERRLLA